MKLVKSNANWKNFLYIYLKIPNRQSTLNGRTFVVNSNKYLNESLCNYEKLFHDSNSPKCVGKVAPISALGP